MAVTELGLPNPRAAIQPSNEIVVAVRGLTFKLGPPKAKAVDNVD